MTVAEIAHMNFDAVRRLALSLPGATEEPHHQFGSFRVNGKIFLTTPPGEQHIHVFVTEEQREVALTMHPEFVEKLLWGGRVVGVRVNLAEANASAVKDLIRQAYEHRTQSPSRGPRSRVVDAKR